MLYGVYATIVDVSAFGSVVRLFRILNRISMMLAQHQKIQVLQPNRFRNQHRISTLESLNHPRKCRRMSNRKPQIQLPKVKIVQWP